MRPIFGEQTPQILEPSPQGLISSIYILRIWTIPYCNLEIRLLFQIFRSIFFFIIFCYKSTWHIDYIYVCYIQLVSFQTLQTKTIWENKIYLHYWSGELQLLHSWGYPCSQWILSLCCPKLPNFSKKSSKYPNYSIPYFPRINT